MRRLRVVEIQAYERPVRLRLPFRFGVVTLTEAPQIFVRARIGIESGPEGWGSAAELLAPKWFDKNPQLTNRQNFDQLRASLKQAARLYASETSFRTAFNLFASCCIPQIQECEKSGLNRLIACFGPALLDRAILDALCRLLGLSFYDAVRSNLPGVSASPLTPDLEGFNVGGFLSRLEPQRRIHVRHTIGLADPIEAREKVESPGDGLPESLDEVVQKYRHTWFKIKVSGDVDADVERLRAVAATLARFLPDYRATLDGNEQYRSWDELNQLLIAISRDAHLESLRESLVFIEQPLARDVALSGKLKELKKRLPVIIDESDSDLEAFPKARRLGYQGVSSKACKGVYRSLLNAARCALWNQSQQGERFFLSAEDLTTQAGLAVQQDLALACVLGITHAERNGHHYVNGMAALPAREQQAFLSSHPDLYHREDNVVRLRIRQGQLDVGSLACPGFASAARPLWSEMQRLM